jgi:hypothetical protein
MTPESVSFFWSVTLYANQINKYRIQNGSEDYRDGTLWKRILEIYPDPDPPSSYGIGILSLNRLNTDSKQIRVIRNDSYYNLCTEYPHTDKFTIFKFLTVCQQ